MVQLSRRVPERAYTATMPVALYTDLAALAAKENRSINKQIRAAVEEQLAARKAAARRVERDAA